MLSDFQSQLSFIRPLTWEEVFEGWREREANNPSWIECATKIKGWSNWEHWRLHTATQLHLQDRSWSLYEVLGPGSFLPNLLMGPFHAWQKYTEEKNTLTFVELMVLPEPRAFFLEHPAVQRLMKQFPAPTELIGLLREDTQKVVCVEGHHRIAAVTLGQVMGSPVAFFGPVYLALTSLKKDETVLLDETLRQGSSRKT